MCGRFTLAKADQVADFLGVAGFPELAPRYNVAPTQAIPVARLAADRPGREPAMLRWGLVPGWSKDLAIGVRCINARAETVAEKPAFRSAYKSRRCLIPADGFYEWAVAGRKKQPYHFALEGGGLFAFAGLWERWGKGDEMVETCALLTTEANDVVAPVHARMPLILHPEAHDLWLSGDPAKLAGLIVPYSGPMTARAVALTVNRPQSEGPGCLEPAG